MSLRYKRQSEDNAQWLQVPQCPPAHDPHPPPVPCTWWLSPLPPRLTAEKREMALLVLLLPQSAQGAGESALLIGRSWLNFFWQLPQTYS